MQFYLKILNEVRSSNHLKVNGASGILYLFKWDVAQRAYTYTPKKQEETEDLVKTTGRTTSYIFCPVAVSQSLPQPPTPPAPLPMKEKLTDSNVAHCLARGIIVTDDDDNATALRLIETYEKGYIAAAHARPSRSRGKQSAAEEPGEA